MRWYPWLRFHFEQLITDYQNGIGHHALLILALPGMGDDSLIYAITRFLLCQKADGNKSCGKCHGCQLMQAGTHPDYYTLGSAEVGKSVLGIDAVRDLREKLYERASLGGAKVVSINNAALLTESASNAMLKILEEPPEKTWFFFSCCDPGRLLPTLRSRCRLYHLIIQREEWVLGWLQREVSVSQDTALAALRLCSGAPVAALELLRENHWMQRAKLCSALNNVLENRDWFSLLVILNHEHAPICLRWLITLLLDALKLQQCVTAITNVDVWPLVNNLAIVLDCDTLHAIIYVLCKCREQLLTVTGLNYELVLADRLLMIEHYLQPGTVLPSFHL